MMRPLARCRAPWRRMLVALVANLCLFAVAVSDVHAQQIKTARPRLFLTPAKLAELRAKMTGSAAERALLANMRAFVDGISNSEESVVYPAAMLYQLDKATYASYGQRACASAYYHITDPGGSLYSPGQWQNYTGQGRYYAWNIAIAYDWAYDACSAAERSAFVAFMTAYYAYHKDHYYNAYTSDGVTYYAPRDNKFIGILRNNAEMAIAIYDASAHPEGATWLNQITAVFQASVVPYLTLQTAQPPYGNGFGGSTSEGSSYGSETQTEYGDLLHALTTGTDTDYWELVPTFALDTLRYQVAISGPTTAGTFNGPRLPYGDDDSQGTDLYYQQYLVVLRITERLRNIGDANAVYGQWWLNNVFDYGAQSPVSGFATDRFYYYSPTAPATSFPESGRDYLTPFMLVSRSDWSANATWVSFMAMDQQSDHEHATAGSFQVYRRGTWLTMDPKIYMSEEPFGLGTAGHNGPILNFHGSSTPYVPYCEDWARLSRTAGGYRGECSAASGYCYAQADMSGVYRVSDSGQGETPDVQSATRDFLYLRPDLIVVADRFRYVTGLSAMSIQNLRAEALPTVSGNRLTLPNGNQRLHVNIVRPAAPVIKAYADSTFRVMGAVKVNDDVIQLHLDGNLNGQLPMNVTLSGGTGQWAALNGTWTCAEWAWGDPAPAGLPYQDGRAYNLERCWITSPGAFAGITGPWNFSQEIVSTQTKDWHYSGGVQYVPFHAQFSGNAYANAESHFLVMQASAATDAPIIVTDRSTASVDAAEFGTTVVASPTSSPPAATLTYSYGPAAQTHYVMGLSPGATYRVAGIGTGTISITPGGAGTPLSATGAGLLVFAADQTAPTVTQHPANQTVTAGGTATFTAAAGGTPTPTVQWQVSADGGAAWSGVPGATETTYAFTVVAGDTGRRYRAVFTNSTGSVASNAATLTVTAPGTPFTDPALLTGVTPVRLVHVAELRIRIDALRLRFGLAPFQWTDATLVAGQTPLRAIHIAELRRALAAAYVVAGSTPPIYTDAALGPGQTVIRAVHIVELRIAVVALE